MRTLAKNKQTIYYATYKSKAALKDDYGNETGEYVLTYNTPVKTKWNVGCVDSDSEAEIFGIEAQNLMRIVAGKDGFPLDESSILWFGKAPHTTFVATAPDHNYAIAGLRPSLNEMVFYARKINTYSPQPEVEE